MIKFSKVAATLIAAGYFPSYPKATEFHVTEDEQAFEDLNNATNHARSLGTEEIVITITREEAENTIELEKELAKTAAADKKTKDAADKKAADEASKAAEENAKKEAADLKAKAAAEKKAAQ